MHRQSQPAASSPGVPGLRVRARGPSRASKIAAGATTRETLSTRGRRFGAALAFAGALGLIACGTKPTAPKSTDPLDIVPTGTQGLFGRSAEDMPGLEVTASGLRFGELSLSIHEASVRGDEVVIERASARWAGDSRDKTCRGSIAATGTGVSLRLFHDSDYGAEPCEKLLEGQWARWEPIAEVPEDLRGTYGSLEENIQLQGGMLEHTRASEIERFELTSLSLPRASTGLVLVREAKFGDRRCRGTLELSDDGVLAVSLSGVDERDLKTTERCLQLRAARWSLAADRLPAEGTWSNGATDVTLAAGRLVLSDRGGGVRCSAEMLGSETIASDRRLGQFEGSAAVPMLGGEAVFMQPHDPLETGEACASKVDAWCAADGAESTPHLCTSPPRLCPIAVVFGEVSDTRWRIGLYPNDIAAGGCLDVSGDFVRATEKAPEARDEQPTQPQPTP